MTKYRRVDSMYIQVANFVYRAIKATRELVAIKVARTAGHNDKKHILECIIQEELYTIMKLVEVRETARLVR